LKGHSRGARQLFSLAVVMILGGTGVCAGCCCATNQPKAALDHGEQSCLPSNKGQGVPSYLRKWNITVVEDVLVWPRDEMPATVVLRRFESSGTVFIPVAVLDLQTVSWRQFLEFTAQCPEWGLESAKSGVGEAPAEVSAEAARAYALWVGRRLPSPEELALAADQGGVAGLGAGATRWRPGLHVRSVGTHDSPSARSRQIFVGAREWCDVGIAGSSTYETWEWEVVATGQGHSGGLSRRLSGETTSAFRCAISLQ
jgi:hypothetical protein